MKPNARQDKLLKQYLHKVLLYHETFNEVYDHVLTSLAENNLNGLSFQDRVNAIISNDFGGVKGLIKMEKSREKLFAREMRLTQWRYFTTSFKISLFPFYIVLFLIINYLSALDIPFYISNIPFLIYIWMVTSGGKTKLAGRSIKLQPLIKIGAMPALLMVMYILVIAAITEFFHINAWAGIAPVYCNLFLTLFTIYALAFYKLYRRELKSDIAR